MYICISHESHENNSCSPEITLQKLILLKPMIKAWIIWMTQLLGTG